MKRTRPAVVVSFLAILVLLAIFSWDVTSSGANQRFHRTDPLTHLASDAPSKPETPSPSYLPPSVHDQRFVALVDRNAKNRVLDDMASHFPQATSEDFSALISVVLDRNDSDTVRHEVVELLKRSRCPDLANTLVSVLDNPSEGPRFRAFAMQHLGSLAQDTPPESQSYVKLIEKFQIALNDKHFTVRTQALQNLCRLHEKKGIEAATAWLIDYKCSAIDEDGKPVDAELERGEVLNQAIRCIHDLSLREQIPVIRKYVRDPNEVIRIAAIVTLSDWHDEDSLSSFEEAANSKSIRLQRCGRAALQRLNAAQIGTGKPDKAKHAAPVPGQNSPVQNNN